MSLSSPAAPTGVAPPRSRATTLNAWNRGAKDQLREAGCERLPAAHVRDHGERHPELRVTGQLRATEAARSHADHREQIAADGERRADRRGTAIEAPGPERVAQHHDGMRANGVVIRRREEPSRGRAEAEQREVVAGG